MRRLCLSQLFLNFFDVREGEDERWEELTPDHAKALIDRFDITGSMEVGETGGFADEGKVHCHLRIGCFHYEHFRVNHERLKLWIEAHNHGPVFVGIKLAPLMGSKQRNYLIKTKKGKVSFVVVGEFLDLEDHVRTYANK